MAPEPVDRGSNSTVVQGVLEEEKLVFNSKNIMF